MCNMLYYKGVLYREIFNVTYADFSIMHKANQQQR